MKPIADRVADGESKTRAVSRVQTDNNKLTKGQMEQVENTLSLGQRLRGPSGIREYQRAGEN